MHAIRLTLWIIIILLGVVLTSLNAQFVTLNYYFGSIVVFLPLLMLILLVIGIFLGGVSMLPKLWRLRHRKSPPNEKLTKKTANAAVESK